jgi:flagellar hook protein FlgE
MLTALSTALSALNAQSAAIDVVGNNLANLNTTGFKAESTQFYDLMYQTMGGANTQIGMGVGTPITQRVFTEGSVQGTSNPLDVAIKGNGFLITKDANGGTLYTRAGNLSADASGNLTDAFGNLVQGWTAANGVVNTAGPVGNLVIPTGSLSAPVATQNLSLTANLDSNTTAIAPASETASNAALSQVIPVYDSLGNTHMVTINFWKTTAGANTWDWKASVPAGDLSGSGSITGSGSLTFDANGNLTSPVSGANPTITISGLADGANDMSMSFNLYNGSNPLITQYAQASGSSTNFSDGSPAGQFVSAAIQNGGQIVATYSNDKQVVVGQLALANFTNPDSLIAVGNNSYQTSGTTSNPSIGQAGSGGRGDIQGSALEGSTADIATEFTNLMVSQRSYEANSKVVTTADTLNQDVINLIH